MNVFHFWPEPLRELGECRRVLKPGGLLVFSLTHHSSWIAGLGDSGVFIAYEPEDVETILRNAGFRGIESHVTTLDGRKCFVVMGMK